jgi:hypothetical protein
MGEFRAHWGRFRVPWGRSLRMPLIIRLFLEPILLFARMLGVIALVFVWMWFWTGVFGMH